LVHKQKPEKIKKLIEKHVSSYAKDHNIVDAIKVDFGHAMDPVESSINSEYIDLVTEATTEGFGVPPKIVPRLGGSLPIYLFPKFLRSPVILVPLSHPDSRNHAPNENIDIPYMESGVVTTVSLLLKMAGIY
jgi:acetylornithine deacetylase/succinyl-diaminopimelate desuccinylase-like protein